MNFIKVKKYQRARSRFLAKKTQKSQTFFFFSGIFPTGKTPLFSPNEPDKYEKYGASLVISLNFL